MCNQFFRPRATGRMEFSARLVLSSNSGYSKKQVSFFHSARAYWQALFPFAHSASSRVTSWVLVRARMLIMLNFRRSRPDYTPPFTCRFARHSAAFEKKTISDDRFPPCFAHELGREGLPGLSERETGRKS